MAVLALAIVILGGVSDMKAQVPAEKQIKAAVLPAPEAMKDGAKVLGYNEAGELVTLRKGEGELICLADEPGNEKFHVSCYYKELEPFMALGRRLSTEGYSRSEVDSIRRERIKSGELPWPEQSTALYSISGPKGGYDYEAGKLVKGSPLYVVYMPYATKASTGFDHSPAVPGAPWIMEDGTPWAHLMIMPEVSVAEINGEE